MAPFYADGIPVISPVAKYSLSVRGCKDDSYKWGGGMGGQQRRGRRKGERIEGGKELEDADLRES